MRAASQARAVDTFVMGVLRGCSVAASAPRRAAAMFMVTPPGDVSPLPPTELSAARGVPRPSEVNPQKNQKIPNAGDVETASCTFRAVAREK
jgi:hypothetical protein